jgi:hypothetical protein
MLAYLFWHRPRIALARDAYEEPLVEFHRSLGSAGIQTAVFRLEQMPFAPYGGYEDWYLVADWAALGVLRDTATRGVHAARHEALAELTGEGWAGVYSLLRGAPRVPAGTRWVQKRREEPAEVLLDREGAQSAWRRELVLGPAAEFCLAAEPSASRARLWPA